MKHHKSDKGYKLKPPTVKDMAYWLKLKHPQYPLLGRKNKRAILDNVKIKEYIYN